MARVVWARRHLVGHQLAAFEHEKFDAQHADVAHALGKLARTGYGFSGGGGQNIRCGHLRQRQDAGAVQVLLHGQLHHRAVTAARDDDADFMRQRQLLLQQTRRLRQRGPGRRQGGGVNHDELALAVVAQLRGLQDGGEACGVEPLQVCGRRDDRVGRARHGHACEERLFACAVLANAHGRRAGCHAHLLGQGLERGGRHVLEFGGHGQARRGQLVQGCGVEIGRQQVDVRDQPGRALRVGVEHGRAKAQRLRGVREHAPELASAHYAEC